MIRRSAARLSLSILPLLLAVVCWPSTSHAQKIDVSQIGTGTATTTGVFSGPTGPNNESYLFVVNTCSPSTEYGQVHTQNATDDLTGCLRMIPGGFAPVANAVSGYCRNELNGSCNGGYFQSICRVNSSLCFGNNSVAQDLSSLTGVTLIGQESDVFLNNTTSAGAGVALNGNFAVQPTNMPGYAVNRPDFNGGTGQWTQALWVGDGATTGTAIQIGALTRGNNQNSQNITLFGRDSGGVAHAAIIGADPVGDLILTLPSGKSLQVPNILAPSGTTLAVPTVGANLVSDKAAQTLTNKTINFGATSQKSGTGADTNVLTVTPPANAGSYRIRFVMSVSAASAATLGWTATWTDSNGNAQTPTNLALTQSGTAAPALTFTTSAAGNYYGYADIDVNNAGTNIVVKLTFSGTSFTAKVSATVERVI